MRTFSNFPTVLTAIRMVCQDNSIPVNENLCKEKVPGTWLQDFERAEVAADQMSGSPLFQILPDDEIEMLEADGGEEAIAAFATGEQNIPDALIGRVTHADSLQRVLEAVFDGDLVRLVHGD